MSGGMFSGGYLRLAVEGERWSAVPVGKDIAVST